MNQTCRVCGEPAAGFHFGAFTCEGCKSFFGRSYNNLNANECKNNNKCIIDKKNRTTCKSCRLRKCLLVGMSKGSSRYGRRSNWFKIHCLLQEHQQQAMEAAGKAVNGGISLSPTLQQQTDFHQQQQRAHHRQQLHQQHHQQRNNAAAVQLAVSHGFLGAYSTYHGHQLPMDGGSAAATAPFMPAAALAAAAAAARHPAAAEAAAFFNIMNSPQSAFQIPSHLLLSAAAAGYHPNAAAAAAADAVYRTEMLRHRQSVDSNTSIDSQPRYAASTNAIEKYLQSSAASSPSLSLQSPELCVSGDDEEPKNETKAQLATSISTVTEATIPPVQTTSPNVLKTFEVTKIHSPIPIRAKPLDLNNISHRFSPLCGNNNNDDTNDNINVKSCATTPLSPVGLVDASALVPTPTPTPTSGSQPRTPEPHLAAPASFQLYTHHHHLHQQHHKFHQPSSQQQQQSHSPQPNAEQTALAFAAKMQSLSPVSVCSIGAETGLITTEQQDSPIDLSMKTTTTTDTTECGSTVVPPQKSLRRKFYQLHSENECNSSSSSSSLSSLSTPTAASPFSTSSLSLTAAATVVPSSTLAYTRQCDETTNTNNNINKNNNSTNKSEISAPNSPTETALISVGGHAKRQKPNSAGEGAAAEASATATTTTTAAVASAATNYNNFPSTNHGATSLHGFFVCV